MYRKNNKFFYFLMIIMSQYSYFGDANPLTPEIVDPVEQCVGNTFFTKTGIAGGYMQKDFCPRFMAQRCATKWDDYCEAFLSTSNYDMGGYTHVNKDFLAETARAKYCRLNKEASGTQCAKKCEALIPEGQNSVTICENVGTQNYLDTKKEFDLAGNFPQTSKLTPVSPLYMDKCPEICDAKETTNADSLSPDDVVMNKCIENGACDRILADLAYNSVKNNLKITNPAFIKLVEYSKLNKPVNVNQAIQVAKSFGIPPSVALDVLKSVKYGESLPSNPEIPNNIMNATPEQLQSIENDNKELDKFSNDLFKNNPPVHKESYSYTADSAPIPTQPIITESKNYNKIYALIASIVLLAIVIYFLYNIFRK